MTTISSNLIGQILLYFQYRPITYLYVSQMEIIFRLWYNTSCHYSYTCCHSRTLSFGRSKLKIIVVSTWRSGSSLTGSIMTSCPGSLYFYEPLAGLLQKTRFHGWKNSTLIIGNRIVWFLKNWMHCDFEYLRPSKTKHMCIVFRVLLRLRRNRVCRIWRGSGDPYKKLLSLKLPGAFFICWRSSRIQKNLAVLQNKLMEGKFKIEGKLEQNIDLITGFSFNDVKKPKTVSI